MYLCIVCVSVAHDLPWPIRMRRKSRSIARKAEASARLLDFIQV